MSEKLTGRARLYLGCIQDWSDAREIAIRLGDTPPPHYLVVKAMMGRMITRGLAEWHYGNNTYRITDKGRAALKEPT